MSGMVGECAVCGARRTTAEIELPPRALTLMRHGHATEWESIVGTAIVRFCEDDWRHVIELVADEQLNPLPQCNARYVEYTVASDSEDAVSPAGLSQAQLDLEATLWQESQATLGEYGRGDSLETDIAAQIVVWSLETLLKTH